MRAEVLRPVRRAFGSLKLRLALTGMAAIGLSVALTTVLVLHNVEQRNERSILDTERAHAERLAGVLSTRVLGLQSALRAAADQLPMGSIEDFDTMSAFLKSKPVLRVLFSSVFIATPDGRIVALTDVDGTRAPQLSIAERAYFQRTLAQRRPVVSEPVASRVSGEAAIMLAVPVLDSHGRVVAVFGGGLRLTTRTLMGDLAQSGESRGDAAITIVADATGRIISHPDKQWLSRDAKADPRLIHAVAHWTAQGRSLKPTGSARRMANTIVAVAGVPDAGWVLLRTAPA
jgi:hypothetical protein